MNGFLDQFRFLQVGWRDVLEVGLVAYALYRILKLVHGPRAVQMLSALISMVLLYAVAWVLQLTMLLRLLAYLFTFAPFAAVVLFAPELRAVLAHFGQARMRLFRRMEASEVADEIADAVERLSRSGIGAIIAVEREVALGEYVQSGSEEQAKVSANLLTTIFTPCCRVRTIPAAARSSAARATLPMPTAPAVAASRCALAGRSRNWPVANGNWW